MRSLPLPVTLTARLLPVAVLACVGWAYASGPMSDTASKDRADPQPSPSASHRGDNDSVAAKTYTEPPAPCSAVAAKTVASLVPDAKTAGKELSATDKSVRRGCSWSALKGYDYRWLDVSFEVKDSDALAQKAFQASASDDAEAAKGIGDEARIATDLSTKDKQETREAKVTIRMANALVTVTFNGSDFQSKGAPSAHTMSTGALNAARDAAAALDPGAKAGSGT